MGLPRGFADEVRHQADIVKIIGDYVNLKKRGANHVGLCPFHHEKTPSFAVHPTKQIFKCFGCGEGGDVIGFVMRMENCEFLEAVRLIAQKSGISIPASASERPNSADKTRFLYDINEWACQFFERTLWSREGQMARDYLDARSVRTETSKRLRLGYAPESWNEISSHLRRRGATPEQIVASGLVVSREANTDRANTPRSPHESSVYDRFRGRLMFPIFDIQGRAVAFGGRTFRPSPAPDREEPKYLNSPETPIYTKGRHLYGLHLAKESIRREGWAVLVEGYLDFLLPFQEGVPNIAASLGTALTESQARLLRRFAQRVVVNFDADPAGRSATLRSIEVLMRAGLPVRVLALPQGEDPHSFVSREGGVEYGRRAVLAQSYIDFILSRATEGRDLTHPNTRIDAFRAVLPFLAIVPDSIERSTFSDHVAGRLKLDTQLVHQEVRRASRAQGSTAHPGPSASADEGTPAPAVTLNLSQRRLLAVMLATPDLALTLGGSTEAEHLKDDAGGVLLLRVARALAQQPAINYATLVETVEANTSERDLLEQAVMERAPASQEESRHVFDACLLGLRRQRIEREIASLQVEIEAAERAADFERFDRLYARKSSLRRILAENNLHAEGAC